MTATDAADDDARALMGRLVPGADADLLVRALREEGTRASPGAPGRRESELTPPERALRRVREQLALGEAARTLQHALNNPLTALLAEAQLLEFEPLEEEHRQAVGRIVELARRLVLVTRRLEVGTLG